MFEPVRLPATSARFPLNFGNLLPYSQMVVAHPWHRGKWLRTALPATLVHSADLQDDRKDDRMGLFQA